MAGGGRMLDDDFDADDVPDLELGTGPSAGPAKPKAAAPQMSTASTQGDVFDDEDEDTGGPLELDVAPNSSHAQRATAGGSAPAIPNPASDPRLPQPSQPHVSPAPSASGSHPSLPGAGAGAGAGASPSAGSLPDVSGPPQPPPPPPPPDPATVFAAYGPSPAHFWETPFYAYRVTMRQAVLKRELVEARKARSPHVPMYEAALRAHDDKAMTLGFVLTAAVILFGGLLFCLPVILRIINSPD